VHALAIGDSLHLSEKIGLRILDDFVRSSPAGKIRFGLGGNCTDHFGAE
jgi:hypothetical protein